MIGNSSYDQLASLLASGLATKQVAMSCGSVGLQLLACNDTTSSLIAVGSFVPALYSVYGSGSAFSLTATASAIVMGTTSPSLTIPVAGLYVIDTRLVMRYNAATFLAARTVAMKLRRTNNTATDLPNAFTNPQTNVVSLFSGDYEIGSLPRVGYLASAGDVISIYGSVSIVPTLGSLDVVEASIFAERVA